MPGEAYQQLLKSDLDTVSCDREHYVSKCVLLHIAAQNLWEI